MTDKYKEYALQLMNEKLFEMEEIYQAHLTNFVPYFQENFRKICEKIVELQQSDALGEISYLEYTLLYTNLIQQKDIAEIRVYQNEWYFDTCQQAVGTFDFSSMFLKYRELEAELTASRKRFAGAVTARETVEFLLSCAHSFYKYITAVCRFAILPCIEQPPFLQIRRAGEFEINVGEYMAHTESIYKENRQRNPQDTLSWFSQRLELAYAFEDFYGLDFSGADLSEIDLRYSDLRHTRLAGTDLQDSMLFGTRFCYADMEGADLRYCMIHEADFTGACLAGARFAAAKAYRGVPEQSKWIMTGYQSVSFRNADLTNADFRKADIRDADFTDAVMTGAVIQKKQLDCFALSHEQKNAVTVTE